MNTAAKRQIERLEPWFHNLHLPDGTQTAPNHKLGDFPAFKWKQIAPNLPASLRGWRALDIGCNAGFYSFELARRGATVVGIDVDLHYLKQARWAAKLYGLDGVIDFRQMEIYELAYTREVYDLVLFMGVFYHLRYPVLGLDIAADKTKRMMVFQSLTMPGIGVHKNTDGYGMDDRDVFMRSGWPKMAFVEHTFAQDPTNWWIPNHACIEALLRSAGLAISSRPGHEIYLCKPARPRRTEMWHYRNWLRSA